MPNDEGHFTFLETDNVEFENPINYFASLNISAYMTFGRETINANNLKFPKETIDKTLFRLALEDWEKSLGEYKSIQLPSNLIALLDAKSKRDQVKLLKGLSIAHNELIAFILMAFEKFGYTFSSYKSEYKHRGLNETDLPKLIYKDTEGVIKTIGDTVLTKGQQKQVLEHRKVVTSKFIDKGEEWHCFFITMNSIYGKENYKNGQPHLHYISDKWNIKRKDIVEQLGNRDYKLPTLPHIDYHTYRNPKKENN